MMKIYLKKNHLYMLFIFANLNILVLNLRKKKLIKLRLSYKWYILKICL